MRRGEGPRDCQKDILHCISARTMGHAISFGLSVRLYTGVCGWYGGESVAVEVYGRQQLLATAPDRPCSA